MARDARPHGPPRSSASQRALARLRQLPVNFSVADRPTESGDGWLVDHDRQPLPAEPAGPPVAGGSWEIAQQAIRDYQFADPRIVRAVYDPQAPLHGRDMLLIGRFYGLRFHMGVRVDGVIDEESEVDGRPVRAWGWEYKTLQGHLEAGQMDYEVWKWVDTGEVEFRMRRYVRAGTVRSGLVRLGWWLFGRWMQQRFVRRACERMVSLVRYRLGLQAEQAPSTGVLRRPARNGFR